MKSPFTFLVLLMAAQCGMAQADTNMDVEMGWGGQLYQDRWSPVFVTTSGDKPRNVVLDIEWPTGGAYAMRIQQFLTIDANPRTFSVLVPVRGWGYQQSTFTLRDAASGKTLAQFPKDPDAGIRFNRAVGNEGQVLVGVSGRPTDLTTLQNLVPSLAVGYLQPRRVPESAMGFDSLSVLVLNEPNLVHSSFGPAALTDAQQLAIVDWVRAGGNLILWPGDNGFPSRGPLVDLLPASLGQRVNFTFTDDELAKLGWPRRYKSLAIFQMQPRAGARKILFPGPDAGLSELGPAPQPSDAHGPPLAFAGRVGLGRIVLVPLNLSELYLENTAASRRLWRPLLDDILVIPDEKADASQATPAQPGYSRYIGADDSSIRLADFLGNVPGAGTVGFNYIAVVLIGLMVVVGPVDWFVLKKLGRQPWTWVTTSGWIALVTLAALFAGHLFKSGDLHYRTLRTIDQVGDSTVATTDYVALYSPRTRSYSIQAPPDGWWQPTGVSAYGGQNMTLDLDFHQTDEGNTPEPMIVNVWSLRFLRGDTIAAGPAMLDADLHVVPGPYGSQVTGTVTNLSEKPLKNIQVTMRGGEYPCTISTPVSPASAPSTSPAAMTEIPAHSTARIVGKLQLPRPEAATYNLNRRYGTTQEKPPDESELPNLAANLSPQRSGRMTALAATGKYAIVHAESVNPEPAATLVGATDHERHWQFIRALIELHDRASQHD